MVLMAPTALCLPNDYCASGNLSMCLTNSFASQKSSKIEDCKCNAGFYAADGVSVAGGCTVCPANSYCLAASTTSMLCVMNAVTASVQTTSLDYCYCYKGYTCVNNSVCVACAVGQWCYNGQPNQCPPNSTSPAFSSYASNCTCNAGYYATTGSCSICQAGTYALAGSSACVLCAKGKFSTALGTQSQATCQNCAAG